MPSNYFPDRLWLIERCGLHPDAAGWLAALQADVKENRRRLRWLRVELTGLALLWILIAGGGIGYLFYLSN